MARKKSFNGQGSSGSGGSLDPQYAVSLPVITDLTLNAGAAEYGYSGYGAGMQLNASQFGYAQVLTGHSNINNNIAFAVAPFKVNSDGSVTLGTEGVGTNSSGTSVSTTITRQVTPGKCLCYGYQYWSGSYQVVSWRGAITTSNTATVNATYVAYSGNWVIPDRSDIVPIPCGSTGVVMQGSDGSNYPAYTLLVDNGSVYAFNSASNTATTTTVRSGPAPAEQAWNETAWSPVGLEITRTNNSYYENAEAYTIYEWRDNGSRTNIGSYESRFNADLGVSNRYPTVRGFRLATDRAVYVSGEGKAIATDAAGTLVSSNLTIAGSEDIAGVTVGNAYWTALGNGYFASLEANKTRIIKLSLSGTTLSYQNICAVDFSLCNLPVGNTSASRVPVAVFSAQGGKYLVTIFNNGQVVVQDLASIASLLPGLP